MLFHSWIFFVFFAIVYTGYLLVRNSAFRVPWLLLASYVFYGWWNWYYLLLILYATVVDYLCVRAMRRWRHGNIFVVISVSNNLALLAFYKYAEFFIENLNVVLMCFGVSATIPEFNILLPVGISFFVFQSMSYVIDFNRGHIAEEPNFLRYAAFVALFPQLVAGPIERARNLLPQLRQAPPVTLNDFATGSSLFLTGLFKKVALADYVALYVDEVYAVPELYDAPALLLATFAFAWQIYFDFSGYTDMARGIARMMGIRLMLNFRNPYVADSLDDLWKRWHISLSTWFRDYVYIPLGGNREGLCRTYVNMFLTMLIAGFWHGAAWTFIAWGALHALGRIATQKAETTDCYRFRIPKVVKQLSVFLFWSFCLIFFRSNLFSDALLILKRLFTTPWSDPHFPVLMAVFIAIAWAGQFLYESRFRHLLQLRPLRIGTAVFMLVYLILSSGETDKAFIYFQF